MKQCKHYSDPDYCYSCKRENNAGTASLSTDGDLAIGIGSGLTIDSDGDLGIQIAPGISMDFNGND